MQAKQEQLLKSHYQGQNFNKYYNKMEHNNISILLVDDDMDYLFQVKMKLEKYGYTIITADGQLEAEKILQSTKPDLAIFDLMMENDDSGFILAYKLKKKYPNVPVIIATAVTAETGMAFGINSETEKSWIKADLYLEKGIRGDKLNEEIKKLLKI